MSKHLVEFTRSKASMIVEYNQDDQIVNLQVDYNEMDDKGKVHLLDHIPSKKVHLDHYMNLPNVKVSDIPFDTSFICFWNAFANKFGNKSRSERLWQALNEEQRIKAILYIQVYNQWLLKNNGVSKKLPETYLNQQPWNN